jgi:hypothetical protein
MVMESEMSCPEATKDVELNLKNRNWAFANVGYGPANPELEDEEFWEERAQDWNTSVDNAKTMRCGNCAAFIVTPEMLVCIQEGLGLDEDYEREESEERDLNRASTLEAAELGYCQLFGFKCAASRTCSAWLVGGPISKEPTDRQKNMVAMARLEYDRD